MTVPTSPLARPTATLRPHDRYRPLVGDRSRALQDERYLARRARAGRRPGRADRRLAEWAAEKGAVSFNCYFVVATGRASGMRGLSPRENDEVLAELVALGKEYRGRMMVRSKCQPQIMRHAWVDDPESGLRDYATRCPCGVQYCRITPEGKVTPCPYMPVEAGDLASGTFGAPCIHSSPASFSMGEPQVNCEPQIL